jgi:hypothetical protein
MIIFSISSNLLGRYDQRSRLSSVSVIPHHDLFSIRDPWSWWQSLIMFIFSRLDNTFNSLEQWNVINYHWDFFRGELRIFCCHVIPKNVSNKIPYSFFYPYIMSEWVILFPIIFWILISYKFYICILKRVIINYYP